MQPSSIYHFSNLARAVNRVRGSPGRLIAQRGCPYKSFASFYKSCRRRHSPLAEPGKGSGKPTQSVGGFPE